MDAVHRGAGADHGVETEGGLAVRGDLFVEPVDEVDLSADGVDAGRAVADVVDDELGRAVGVGGVDDLLGAFLVDDDSDAGIFLAGALDLVDSEADVNGAVSLPKQDLALFDSFFGEAAVDLARAPDSGLGPGVDAEALAGVATEVLVGEEEDLVALLEGPLKDGGGVGGGADGARRSCRRRL